MAKKLNKLSSHLATRVANNYFQVLNEIVLWPLNLYHAQATENISTRRERNESFNAFTKTSFHEFADFETVNLGN